MKRSDMANPWMKQGGGGGGIAVPDGNCFRRLKPRFASNCSSHPPIKKEDDMSFNIPPLKWRRRGDSNPRDIAAHTISNRAPSTTQPPLRIFKLCCGFSASDTLIGS